jgi:hypothetical protein
MSVYRARANSSITVKMHILEDHVVDFIKRHKVGLGFLGEQGAESIHNRFNQLQRQYCCVPNSLKRFELMLKEHHRQTHPANISKVPVVKPRKQVSVEE